MASEPNSTRLRLEVTLKPVTSESDIPALAQINESALEGDPLKEWMRLYTERTEWENTVKAVTEGLTDPTYSLVKAVIPDPEHQGEEKIIGFVHWMCGWIVLDKVDPVAEKSQAPQQDGEVDNAKDVKDVSSNLTDQLEWKAQHLEAGPDQSQESGERAERLRKGEAKYVQTRNHYIAAIRGKKHMYIRRLMVLPEYQGRGIGSKLLKMVTDEADRQKIVCWLFSRPIAERKLYEPVGFRTIGVTEMDEPEDNFVCPPAKAMMRSPRPKT